MMKYTEGIKKFHVLDWKDYNLFGTNYTINKSHKAQLKNKLFVIGRSEKTKQTFNKQFKFPQAKPHIVNHIIS